MDILVLLEENPYDSPVLAHVNSVPEPLDSEQPARDIVTMYGDPSAESIALALAAAVEGHRAGRGAEEGGKERGLDAVRYLGVWAERGAVGDEAWRDDTGQLVTRDLEIPLDILRATATRLMNECGEVIGRLVDGLSMSNWPAGARRAINVSLGSFSGLTAPVLRPLESILDKWREADGLAFDCEGD